MTKTKIYLPKTFAELKNLNEVKLRELWHRYFDRNIHIFQKNMMRALWYKVQCENTNLKIEQKHLTKLNRYAVNPDECLEKSVKTKYYLKPGTEIIKKYKGKQFRVLVKNTKEFICGGKTYKTLSAVAKDICGLKVSGPDFFGLSNKKAEHDILRSANE